MRKRLALCAMVLFVALSTSGCFLRALLGGEVVESLSEQIDRIISAVSANATTAVCRTSPFTNTVECDYVITDPEGFLATTTSTASLVSEFGLFGVIVDPLVLEVPATVTNIAGTYDDGTGHSGALVVHAHLSFVPVDDTHTITPGAGKQLVIVDLPDGVPVNGVTFQYDLSFEQQVPAGTGPTQIKALFTGKAEINGKTFYPPMLPCTTDFSTITPITLPRSSTMRQLFVPPTISGCTGQHYQYFQLPDVCDLNNDHIVDRRDVDLIRAMVGASVAPGDPRDIDDDLTVGPADVQACAARCTGPGCSVSSAAVGVTSGSAYNFDQVDRGFARIIGQFTSTAPLDLGAASVKAKLIDPLLETDGSELVGKLPVTLLPRTRSQRVTVFESMIGAALYRVVVRTCIPTREKCPNVRGLDAGQYEFRIEVVNGLVHAPTDCGNPTGPRMTAMTTHFAIDDGINPPVDVVIPNAPWACSFGKNRVTAIRTP